MGRKGDSEEHREWALQRFKQGKWHVAEPFGGCLLFAPRRFVGYKDNSMKKHTENYGDSTQTNNRLKSLSLYKECSDGYLAEQFELFMSSLGIVNKSKSKAKFFIPSDMNDKDYTDASLDGIKKDYPNDRTAMPAFILMKQIRHGDIVCCTQNNSSTYFKLPA